VKAAIIEKFGSIVVKDMAEPKPGEYDALCEMLYGATCTGTDSHIIDGSFPWISPLPTVLGHESVGRVVSVGKKVRHLKVGDIITRVGTPPSPSENISISWGGFAELGIAKDHWAMCAKVAPMFTTWRETLSYITRLGVKSGTSVLVVGSGGNGLSYARHAVNLGASVVAMAGAAYLESATKAKAGVHIYLDYKRKDLDSALDKLHPDGFDFIIDAVGKAGIADKVLPCLKSGGAYGTYGLDDMGKIVINPAKARGTFRDHPCSYDESETHQQISEWVMQGKLDASLWYDVDKQYPLARISDAYADVLARKSPKALVRLHK
jgi:L-iditol 2-dehydrogenase